MWPPRNYRDDSGGLGAARPVKDLTPPPEFVSSEPILAERVSLNTPPSVNIVF